MNSIANNKRVAKNTLLLYFRMLLIMLISLYTVRAVLEILGIIDYGIYNVVGSVVTMFSFLSNSLGSSSNRFFSIELGKRDFQALHKTFCLNITLFGVILLFIFVLAEIFGLWYINYKMVLSSNRLFAANVVYQFSLLGFGFQMLSLPYISLITAHERMKAFAYLGTLEAGMKLLVVFVLDYVVMDKLILYGLLVLIVVGITSSFYYIYCRIYFEESRYVFFFEKKSAIELLSFSGWNCLGAISMIARGQGINLLINIFFNPAVNAARAIAFQVEATVGQFSNNFFTAVRPQMYKSYANKEYLALFRLINLSTIMCLFLVSVLIFPLLFNTAFILSLWLKNVPDHAELFLKLVLVNGLIDTASNSVYVTSAATGRVRNFYLASSILTIFNLPISYLALLWGAIPEITVCISILISIFAVYVRAYMLKSVMGIFPFKSYIYLVARILGISVLIYLLTSLLFLFPMNEMCCFFSTSTMSVSLVIFCYYSFIIDKEDKKKIKETLYKNVIIKLM